MSAGLPESIDVWRAAGAGRVYEGHVELARLTRLLPSLTDGEGRCEFRIEFSRDASSQASARVIATAQLPLLCERSLERFLHPVAIDQMLGLIRDEADEAALLPEVEPVLVADNGMMRLLDLLEDELILALPVLPARPGTEPVELEVGAEEVEREEVGQPNPFAALASFKPSKR
ncbi:MAG: YceD family protein [Pseudomarimonas sp.]